MILTLCVVNIENVCEICDCTVFAIWSCATALPNPGTAGLKVGMTSVQIVHPHVVISARIQLNCGVWSDKIIVVCYQTLHCHGLEKTTIKEDGLEHPSKIGCLKQECTLTPT